MVGCREHLADKEHVVACRMPRVMAALEPRGTVFDERRFCLAEMKRHARESIKMRAREAPREIDLIVREDIDGVALGGLEHSETSRAPGEAPDDERRIERYRIERVRGEADEPVRRPGRDDRDAGRELAQRIAKLPFGDGWAPFARVGFHRRDLRREA